MSLQRALVGCLQFVLGLGLCAPFALAAVEGEPIHHSAKNTVWDRKANRVHLMGNAVVNQPSETIEADEILLDLNERLIDAKGNVVYIASDSVIYAQELHFHLDSHAGTIVGGRVLNTQFSLAGERINKLGDGRFQTHWGEYTTCRDCPGSWSLAAEDVDVIFGGYGFFKNVTAKVKDTPGIWLPYLIVPIKTQRQSGFLFPRFSFNAPAGFIGLLPFFWAIHRSADMTLSGGLYSARGFRAEWEGRYTLGSESGGTATFNYLNDQSGTHGVSSQRWNLHLTQSQRLPWGFMERINFSEVSDNLYSYTGAPDALTTDMGLVSTATLSQSSDFGAASVSLFRTRSILNTDPSTTEGERRWRFDTRTVQAYPRVLLTTTDWFAFGGPVAFGTSFAFDNFTRESGDTDSFGPVRGGILRRARRMTLVPQVYTTLRPFDIFALTPSIQYRMYYYNFAPTTYDLLRSYPVIQADLYAQIERVFERPESKNFPRMKHLIRPTLNYSIVPHERVVGRQYSLVREDESHPFIQQIADGTAANVPGLYFDSNDLVPITSSPNNLNYLIPIGHALTYGIRSQWILRSNSVADEVGSYHRMLEVYANHALNFLDPVSPAYTRFNSGFDFNLYKFNLSVAYEYTPPVTTPAYHAFSVSAGYVLDRGMRQGILEFDRSFSISFVNNGVSNARSLSVSSTFSINDFIMPSAGISYDLTNFLFQSAFLGLTFQSTSRCWRLRIGQTFTPATQFSLPTPELTINLTGSGFSALEAAASSFVSR